MHEKDTLAGQFFVAMRSSRWAVSTAFFINGFLLSTYISRLPHLQDRYDLNYQELGFVLLASAIGSLIAMPFTGALILKFSSRKVTSLALGSLCLLVALFILAPSYLVLLVSFFLIGVSSGMTDVAMNAQAVVVEKNAGKSMMSSFHGIWSVGLFAGAAVGSLFIALKASMLIHFSLMGFFSLILLFYFFPNLVPDESHSNESGAYFQLPDKALIAIGIIAFCAMLGEGAMADWSAVYMKDIMGLADKLAPSGLVVYSLAMLLARFMGDRIRGQMGDRQMIQTGSSLSLAGMLLIIFSAHFLISLGGFLLAGLGLATIVPIAYSRAGSTEGIAPGVGISMVTTIGYSGFIVGPPIIGFIAEQRDLRTAFSAVAILFIIMLVMSFRIR